MRFGKAKEDLLFFVIVVPIFLVLILMTFLFLTRESTHSRQVLEYEAARLSSDLLELSGRAGQFDFGGLRQEVIGFGVYGPAGSPTFRVGSAPEAIRHRGADLYTPTYDYSDNRLVMIRPVGFSMSAMRGMGRMMRGLPGREPGPARAEDGRAPGPVPPAGRYLYLEIDINEWRHRQTPLRLSMFFIPVLLGVVLLGVSHLYRKNRGYRIREEQTRRLVSLGEAARTLTHEIKNPLGAIKIQTAMLRKIVPEEFHDNLAIITEETDRLNHLVDRVGEFLRNPRGEPERIDLDEFVQELLQRFSVPIAYTPPGEMVVVLFDRHRLRTVLENLLKNAVESMDEEPAVEVLVKAGRNRLEVKVLDRGSGLPTDAGERVFDPFFTTKTKGSGIGLAVSRRFVDAMGGSLLLRPREGGGTEAVVQLLREERQ